MESRLALTIPSFLWRMVTPVIPVTTTVTQTMLMKEDKLKRIQHVNSSHMEMAVCTENGLQLMDRVNVSYQRIPLNPVTNLLQR